MTPFHEWFGFFSIWVNRKKLDLASNNTSYYLTQWVDGKKTILDAEPEIVNFAHPSKKWPNSMEIPKNRGKSGLISSALESLVLWLQTLSLSELELLLNWLFSVDWLTLSCWEAKLMPGSTSTRKSSEWISPKMARPFQSTLWVQMESTLYTTYKPHFFVLLSREDSKAERPSHQNPSAENIFFRLEVPGQDYPVQIRVWDYLPLFSLSLWVKQENFHFGWQLFLGCQWKKHAAPD